MKILEYTARDTGVDLTSSGADSKLGQRIQLKHAAPIGRIALLIKRVGTPSGYLQCKLYSDSSSLPNAVTTNGSSDGILTSGVGTAYAYTNFDFDLDGRPTMEARTNYHVVLEPSSGYTYANGSAEIIWGVDATDPYYVNGEAETYDGTDWTNRATASDFCLKVYTRRRTGDEYWSLSEVEAMVKHLTNGGVFDNDDSKVSVKQAYDFGETVSNEIDAWLAGAGFSTPVTSTTAKDMFRKSANAGVAMHCELSQPTAGFRGERGADTRTGALRVLYLELKKALEDDGEFVDTLIAIGLSRAAAGQLGRGLSAGGILDDDLTDWEDDDSLVHATFRREIWDNP